MEPLRGEAWWKEVRALGDAHEEDTGAQTPPVFTSVMSEGQHPPPSHARTVIVCAASSPKQQAEWLVG